MCFKIDSVQAFIDKVLVPDHSEFMNDSANIRLAFHDAIDLFHLVDWVFHSNKTIGSLNFIGPFGSEKKAKDEKEFANILESEDSSFGIIRGVANSLKHLELRAVPKTLGAPTHAANTFVSGTGYGMGRFGEGPFGGTETVKIQGPDGDDRPYSVFSTSVLDMWRDLFAKNGWGEIPQ